MRIPFPFLLALALATPAAAQDTGPSTLPLPELKTQLAAGKQVVVARHLALSPAEEADFWPAYDEFQRGLADIAGRRRAALAAIAGGDPDQVADAMETFVEADLEQAELTERVWDRLRGDLAPAKLARYLLLERRIATLERSEGR